jgi:hypothetical protein
MFIRRTQAQKRRAGGFYYTYRLVESQRIKNKVRQRTLLNLGTDFYLPKEKWPILTTRIKEILGGQRSLFEIDCNIHKLAGRVAARILIKQQEKGVQSDSDYREVNVNSLVMSRPRGVGCEHVTLEALRFLAENKERIPISP